MQNLKYCPMAQQEGCLTTKCAFFDEEERLCIIILGYMNNLESAILAQTSPQLLNLLSVGSVESVSEACLSHLEGIVRPIVRILRLLDRLQDLEGISNPFRKRLQRMREDIQEGVDRF